MIDRDEYKSKRAIQQIQICQIMGKTMKKTSARIRNYCHFSSISKKKL
jgi:hypothetical protein